MPDEAISAASTTKPMRSMHYFRGFSTVACLVPSSVALPISQYMRGGENPPCLFSSYSPFCKRVACRQRN